MHDINRIAALVVRAEKLLVESVEAEVMDLGIHTTKFNIDKAIEYLKRARKLCEEREDCR